MIYEFLKKNYELRIRNNLLNFHNQYEKLFSMNKEKISDFKDLMVWKSGHKLVLLIYRVTKQFPKDEIYGLVSQMKRASVSVTSNVAEGFGRRGLKDKLRFYYLSHGSLVELKNQIIISKDVGYINDKSFEIIMRQANMSHKLLRGLIRKTESFLIPNS